MNKILKIEALRGFVAIYVVMSHIYFLPSISKTSFTTFFIHHGDLGVAIFFIISGFVIHLSFINGKNKSFKNFFLKRFLRIYIPLLLVFSITAIIFWMQRSDDQISFLNLGINLLMLQNLESGSTFLPLFNNIPLWSLTNEWWYYMFYFFIMTSFSKKSTMIVYSICILGSIIYFFYPLYMLKVISELSLWWFGVEIAKLYINRKTTPINFKNLLFPLVIIFLSTTIYYFSDYFTFKFLLKGLISILIGLLWLNLKWFGFNYTINLFLPLGKISYCLYIAHFPLIIQATFLDRYIFSLGAYRYLIYSAICLIVCYLIEVILYPILYKFLVGKMIMNLTIKN